MHTRNQKMKGIPMARPRTTRAREAQPVSEERRARPVTGRAERSASQSGLRGQPMATSAPKQETIKEWIRRHEEAALIAAFAFGVLIGVLLPE